MTVERIRARYGAWYEMFPRSTGSTTQAERHLPGRGEHLPYIAAMGFDVVYLPPIHPIGHTHRKGPNNSLAAGPDDPGSPWAIGGPEGGHKAVHPDLGTMEDFDFFVTAAASHGLEVALDIAFQCSPDHPYVREHPEWFRHRPDGTIKYAENPPKKYQDIYPLNFECPAWESLWQELKSVVLFWIDRGVRDLPGGQPAYQAASLLALAHRRSAQEAFRRRSFSPRPLPGRRSCMPWPRLVSASPTPTSPGATPNTELIEYVTALTRTGVREYFRPNFFANTPDILPEFLQFGGRPAFLSPTGAGRHPGSELRHLQRL